MTPTAQLTSTRPSFFEVYAAQHLNTALRPAIRFIIDIISLRHPLLRPLSNWADESFTLLLLLIETAQLSQHSSLLSESFYALRRTASPTLSSSPANSILTPPQIALALFLDVVCPHINAKLDAVHSTATGGAAADLFDSNSINAPSIPPEFSGSFPAPNSGTSVNTSSPARVHIPHWVSLLQRLLSSPKQALAAAKALYTYMRTARFRALLLRYYPAVKSLIEACNMLLGMLYLYGYTPYFSLSLLIQRLALRRDSQLDFLRVAISNKLYTPSRLHGLKVATLRLLSLLKTGFLASIFAFRFLQYYYSAEVCNLLHAHFPFPFTFNSVNRSLSL